MKNRLAVAAALIAISISTIGAVPQDHDKATIDKFISSQAKRERGEEYPDARKVVTGDLNGDGVAETLVLYTIEAQIGGNSHVQYLAVFKRANGQLVPLTHVIIGGKNESRR